MPMRNRWRLVSLIFVALPAMLSCREKQARIEAGGWPADLQCLPATTTNAGFMYEGDVFKQQFTLRNTGEKPIPIESIKTSCGCTSVLSNYHVIEPHASIDLALRVDTAKKAEGAFTVEANVLLGEDLGVLPLRINGSVVYETPKEHNFGDVYLNRQRKGTRFDLKSLPSETVSIRDLKFDEDYFEVNHDVPHLWNSLKWPRIEIAMAKDAPAGRFEKTLLIITDRPRDPEIRFVMKGRVFGSIEVDPERVSVGVLDPAELFDAVFTIYSPYDEAFAIERVDNPLPDVLTVEREHQNRDTAHRMHLRSAAPFPPGKINGSLKIVTSLNGGEDVEVKFFGLVKSR